jgi:hypothetical protein
LNSVKILENTEEHFEIIWTILKKGQTNSEKKWKIQMKILKRYRKYGRKIS